MRLLRERHRMLRHGIRWSIVNTLPVGVWDIRYGPAVYVVRRGCLLGICGVHLELGAAVDAGAAGEAAMEEDVEASEGSCARGCVEM